MSELRCSIDLDFDYAPTLRWDVDLVKDERHVWVSVYFDQRPLYHVRKNIPAICFEDTYDRWNVPQEPVVQMGEVWTIFEGHGDRRRQCGTLRTHMIF